MTKEKPFTVVNPKGMPKPDGPYSYAIKVKPTASFTFLSGLASRDKEGKGLIGYHFYGKSQVNPAPTGAYTQTMRAMERIQEALGSAGATFDDVVNAKIWLTDISYWEGGAKEAFSKHFHEPYPTITVIAIKRLGLGHLLEIEVVAAV